MKVTQIVKNQETLPGLWRCKKCGKFFSRKQTLRRHMAMVHNAPYTLVNVRLRTGEPVYENPPRELLKKRRR